MAGYLPGLDTMPPASTHYPEAPTVAVATPEHQHKEKILSAVAAAMAERQRQRQRIAKTLSAVPAAAERQPREEKGLSAADKWTIFAIVASVCAVVAGFVWLIVGLSAVLPRDPSYSVAIDSVSGLTTNRTDLALDPEFDLTLRVTSLSRRHKACVDPGTYLEVAYRCVTLATSATVQHELCAGPREAAEQRLVATGTRVRVPGAVLDSLAADMWQGQLVFQVTIRWSGDDDDDMPLASCGSRQVGAADDDLETSCDAWHLCPTRNVGSH